MQTSEEKTSLSTLSSSFFSQFSFQDLSADVENVCYDNTKTVEGEEVTYL